MRSVERARAFAISAHGAQMYGDRPYSAHLDEVAAIVERYGNECVAVAYLHDVLEDTPIRAIDLVEFFEPPIIAAVVAVTDPPGGTRAKRKKELCARLAASHDPIALRVKAADRLANVRAATAEGKFELVDMYRLEHTELRVACFRPGLCDEIWVELDELLEEP